ncbi:hypothetical protein NM208_g12871 [Fusarium decemcellulare]|uniref:Uncharacterized protein n=1 Tax=Fusarium decemcellulare TaxID=57161 RepID=A0ACC1RNZ4_9HYPO|nr:hypothetical protein NM208_g12871 [Fusarium decemcellulare]
MDKNLTTTAKGVELTTQAGPSPPGTSSWLILQTGVAEIFTFKTQVIETKLRRVGLPIDAGGAYPRDEDLDGQPSVVARTFPSTQKTPYFQLAARTVDDLHVNGELTATVVEDEDTDGATARLESVAEAGIEVGLVNDGQTLLDVAGLGHGDDLALLHVKDTVLLEDRAEHSLDDNAGGGVGDERRLLMELLGEEIDTKVAVLAGGRGGRDADDLAGTALKHQEITQADVVAGGW